MGEGLPVPREGQGMQLKSEKNIHAPFFKGLFSLGVGERQQAKMLLNPSPFILQSYPEQPQMGSSLGKMDKHSSGGRAPVVWVWALELASTFENTETGLWANSDLCNA